MPVLRAIAADLKLKVSDTRVLQSYRYMQAKIDPFISTNIGIEQEIANCGDPKNIIRQSILN
ncbi:MAG: hypothetical protein UT21_C0006G0028 [Candidatus Woesebacteria bacterium GW2011_GWA1_39_11b]|nr:MAG: hypothetical protein UT21_C0006G0028 [Candidatus Woesebacteria bacterium GW2011_GWA1_39_11b]KKS77106.1 MAG: hypothetical protein UV51_C0010G0011 [Candidatus Woesebacteria bacterium GW2011_GWC1_42_9]